MTEKQHIALVEIGGEFYEQFSKLVAKCVDKLPPGMDEGDALAYLQDHASIYGSKFREYLKRNQ